MGRTTTQSLVAKLQVDILRIVIAAESADGDNKLSGADLDEFNKMVERNKLGQFMSKAELEMKLAEMNRGIGELSSAIAQGAEITADIIKELVQNPAFRERIGLTAGAGMAQIIAKLSERVSEDSAFTLKFQEIQRKAEEKLAAQYGDDKSPIAQAIRTTTLPEPDDDTGFGDKMEFYVARYAALQQALESPENYQKPSQQRKLLTQFGKAAIPIAMGVAIGAGLELAVPLFITKEGITLASFGLALANSSFDSAVGLAIQKGLDKTDIDNPVVKAGIEFIGSLAAGTALNLGARAIKKAITNKNETTARSLTKYINSFRFRTQSLDNVGKDGIFKIEIFGNNIIEITDIAGREERENIVSSIYDVVSNTVNKRGSRKAGYIGSMFRKGRQFVIEIPTAEKDNIGREAPLVIFGELPDIIPSDWVNIVANQIETVAISLGRTFDKVSPIEDTIQKQIIKEMLSENATEATYFKEPINELLLVLGGNEGNRLCKWLAQHGSKITDSDYSDIYMSLQHLVTDTECDIGKVIKEYKSEGNVLLDEDVTEYDISAFYINISELSQQIKDPRILQDIYAGFKKFSNQGQRLSAIRALVGAKVDVLPPIHSKANAAKGIAEELFV